MTARARFRANDLDRALKVAERNGLGIAGYEIDPDGTIRILTAAGQVAKAKHNPLDRLHGSKA